MLGRAHRYKLPSLEEQPDDQYIVSKNKFYGKTLDRRTDQWVYLERYLTTLNIRVVRGWLQMYQALKNDQIEQQKQQ